MDYSSVKISKHASMLLGLMVKKRKSENHLIITKKLIIEELVGKAAKRELTE